MAVEREKECPEGRERVKTVAVVNMEVLVMAKEAAKVEVKGVLVRRRD